MRHPIKKLPQLVAKVASTELLWNVLWGHHALLMEKIKDQPPAVDTWSKPSELRDQFKAILAEVLLR